MIQMNVSRSNDLMMCMVLHVGKLFLEIPLVVIVHQRQHTDRLCVRILDPFFRQSCADEIPKSFGSGPVSCMIKEFVELLKQIGVYRDPEADKSLWWHGSTFSKIVTPPL